MTIALARRLVREGVAGSDEVSAALRVHVTRRIAFLEALADRLPDGVQRLEAELRTPNAALAVVADLELMRVLPPGLARALLAVPMGRDATTGVIRVAVADSQDKHVVEELAFHFQAPVEPIPVPLRALLAAVRERVPHAPESRTPAHGTSVAPPALDAVAALGAAALGVPSGAAGMRASDRPIPLVRVSPELPKPPITVKGVAPQSGPTRGSPVVVPPRTGAVVIDPVISLTRNKSLVPVEAVPATPAPKPPESLAPYTRPGPVPRSVPNTPAPHAAIDAAVVDSALADLRSTASPEEVVTVLLRGLSGVAARALVLAVRGKVFEGRDATDPTMRDAVRLLAVSGERPSVLLTAVQAGSYVGPIPQTAIHVELAAALGGAATANDEIAVGVVTVSGRAALTYVMAGFQTAFLATRRSDALADAAGTALERIVRDRKK